MTGASLSVLVPSPSWPELKRIEWLRLGGEAVQGELRRIATSWAVAAELISTPGGLASRAREFPENQVRWRQPVPSTCLPGRALWMGRQS